MKKVLCVIAAVAMVAVFTTSCNKTCTCTNYVNDKEVATTTINLDQVKSQLGVDASSCKKASTMVNGTGFKCK